MNTEHEFTKDELVAMMKAEHPDIDAWMIEGLVSMYMKGKLQDFVKEEEADEHPSCQLAKKFGILKVKDESERCAVNGEDKKED